MVTADAHICCIVIVYSHEYEIKKKKDIDNKSLAGWFKVNIVSLNIGKCEL